MSNVSHPARLVPALAVCQPRASAKERLARLVADDMELAARIVRNVGAPDSAIEDLVQQAFQICAARIDDIEPGKERSFLVQTALWLTANARRTLLRGREVVIDDLSDIADGRPSPEELSDQRRLLRKMAAIFGAMDVDMRAVFVLYEVEGMTMAEIAAVLDLAPGTVASRLRRAREEFMARLRRSGVEPSDREKTR
jgi:RNA polymerase sigma-70 factor (ECF subfamily)